MPLATLMPPVGRQTRRSLAALLLLGVAASIGSVITRRKKTAQTSGLCHPTLSHLRAKDGREVLLIGTYPVDLDDASGKLVGRALSAMNPDIVMVEGSWTAGVNAMVLTGKWELHGAPPAPGKINWTDTGNTAPVELPRPKRRGFLRLSAGPAHYPERSLVPVKVGQWAYHLRASVGREVTAALVSAAASGVPLHFLGPQDGMPQGHVQVSVLAQRAAMELLEEEQQRGAQMAPQDVNAALLRAEGHVREEAGRWLKDARAESSRFQERLQEQQIPKHIRDTISERVKVRTEGLAKSIAHTMEDHKRGAVVLAVDQLVAVEGTLLDAGYSYVSNCA